MAKQATTPPHEAAGNDSAKPPSADRRRWLKAGLSAPPVLMTVASRPVLAQTCVPPSAYVSLGASAPGMDAECAGLTPKNWLDTNPWPRGYSQGTFFNDLFVPTLNVSIGRSSNGPKLSEILGEDPILGIDDDSLRDVARYVSAAWLNNASGKVPESVLRAMTIQHIWREFANTRRFAPTSGVSWLADEIVEYLKSTMTGG